MLKNSNNNKIFRKLEQSLGFRLAPSLKDRIVKKIKIKEKINSIVVICYAYLNQKGDRYIFFSQETPKTIIKCLFKKGYMLLPKECIKNKNISYLTEKDIHYLC